jgi:hypothetical protein
MAAAPWAALASTWIAVFSEKNGEVSGEVADDWICIQLVRSKYGYRIAKPRWSAAGANGPKAAQCENMYCLYFPNPNHGPSEETCKWAV